MQRRYIFLPVPLLLALAGCGGGGGGTSTPQPPPPPTATLTVTTVPIFAALTFAQPVALVQAPADPARWFVVEKAGRVRVFDNDPQVTTMGDFVDIRGRVLGGPEAGLLGLAFHPDFAANGEVFLSYTRAGSPLESVISRFRSFDGGLTLDPGSEEIVLTVLQDFDNHNGGQIAFDADGRLFAGFGDGGSASDPNDRAQDDTTLLGKMVRIDVDAGMPYAIPADNPFAGNGPCTQGFGGAGCPEIYASGLRNPWRFSFDRLTGELWIGDVGQGAMEEIDRGILGANYGWRIREGTRCHMPPSNCVTTGLTDPLHAYDRSAGISVTGGFVYRGSAITLLQGRYVFGDFGSGRIWALPVAPGNGAQSVELIDTSFGISAFGEGNDGELYVIDFNNGALHQLIDGS